MPARLPSRTGGRGAALGKSDPTTSATVQARPKLSVEVGEPEQLANLAKIRTARRTARGSPTAPSSAP